jgi:alkylation response protein AidB-like acyl-CoA dehydrogenase
MSVSDWKSGIGGAEAPPDALPAAPEENFPAVAAGLAEAFAATAAARDAQGGTAKRERDALRASGLLRLVVPAEYGGAGRSWPEAFQVVRTLAEADGSLAHLLGYHYLALSAPHLIGSERQNAGYYRRTAKNNLFWGNAFNPPRMDPQVPGRIAGAQVIATREGDGWRLNGRNRYCSGATDSDMLVISAVKAGHDRLADGFLVAAVPTGRAGITVRDDWDGFGQRQTDSGGVDFHDVRVEQGEVLDDPGPFARPFATLRTCLAQTTLAHIYLGIAKGALQAAREFIRAEGKPYFLSGVAGADRDPYVLEKLGSLWVDVEATARMAEAAAARFQEAWDKGDGLTAEERGRLAVAIAGAKAAATRSGLRATSEVFEAMGASSARGNLRLDRYWRNLRTHTLHDPVAYKLKDLGAWFLRGEYPTPSFYS